MAQKSLSVADRGTSYICVRMNPQFNKNRVAQGRTRSRLMSVHHAPPGHVTIANLLHPTAAVVPGRAGAELRPTSLRQWGADTGGPAQHKVGASLSGRSRPIEVPLALSVASTTRVLPCDWRLPGPHPYHISSDCVLIGVLPDCLWIMR